MNAHTAARYKELAEHRADEYPVGHYYREQLALIEAEAPSVWSRVDSLREFLAISQRTNSDLNEELRATKNKLQKYVDAELAARLDAARNQRTA
jgi:hypothetical protein